jgi:hypothetical protein
MLAESLKQLAALVGQTVVAAATTDAWESVKRGLVRLLGRGEVSRAGVLEQRLADTQQQLVSAAAADRDHVRAALEAQWITRLADMLEEDASLEAGLRSLIQDFRVAFPAMTAAAAEHGVAAGRDVNIAATSGGVAIGSVHGNVNPPGPTLPGPANSRPGPG